MRKNECFKKLNLLTLYGRKKICFIEKSLLSTVLRINEKKLVKVRDSSSMTPKSLNSETTSMILRIMFFLFFSVSKT